jgi:hypothetical protein
MKIGASLKLIDNQWVKKGKGYRVHFQKSTPEGWVSEFVPEEADKPLDSDVTAWRLAWKLAQCSETDGDQRAAMANIYVVDEQGNRIAYYATGGFEVFNQTAID